jgi:hypothetical protein
MYPLLRLDDADAEPPFAADATFVRPVDCPSRLEVPNMVDVRPSSWLSIADPETDTHATTTHVAADNARRSLTAGTVRDTPRFPSIATCQRFELDGAYRRNACGSRRHN